MRPFLTSALLLFAHALPAAAVDHSAWDALLKSHVSDGLVDYSGLAEDRGRLDAYLADLANAEPETLSRDEQVAFWANVYNARMVALVLDHYPIHGRDSSHPASSVLQVPGIFKKLTARIGGRDLSLDAIEHQILRPRFAEPRIHAAIVCASGSCPELRAEAFTAERLEQQLDDQFRLFVTDPRRNRFDLSAGVAQLSKIFDWFGGDFATPDTSPALRRAAGKHAGALAFAAAYLPADEREAILAGRLRVEFLPYDWSLNDTVRAPIASDPSALQTDRRSTPPTFGR